LCKLVIYTSDHHVSMGYDQLVSTCLLRKLRMFVELVTSAVLEQAWRERSRIWQFRKTY
jgi:hypothetical protein